VTLGSLTADLCIGAFMPTTSRRSWSVVLLGPVGIRMPTYDWLVEAAVGSAPGSP
jgi:hypothetical protein